MFSPACDWVIEGDHFLPSPDSPRYRPPSPNPDLLAALQTGTNDSLPTAATATQAWAYIASLHYQSGINDPAVLARMLFDSTARLWAGSGQPDGSACAGTATRNLSPPLAGFLTAITSRIAVWLADQND